MIVSAHDVLATRLCVAHCCENLAETSSALCDLCQRKTSVTLHDAEPRTEPMLPCSHCREWKPDNAFSASRRPHLHTRRHRSRWCKQCVNTRRRQLRLTSRERLLAEVRTWSAQHIEERA